MDTITDFSLDAYSFGEIAKLSETGELREKVKLGASKHITLQDNTSAIITLMAFKGDVCDHVPLDHSVFAITTPTPFATSAESAGFAPVKISKDGVSKK